MVLSNKLVVSKVDILSLEMAFVHLESVDVASSIIQCGESMADLVLRRHALM